MPVIIPFRALRAKPEYILKFSSAAYDLQVCEDNYSEPESAEYSYRQVLQPYKRAGEPGFDEDKAITECQEKLSELLTKEYLLQDEKPSLYIYRQIKDGHPFTGIIALASIKDYKEGSIKKHELTRTEKEKQITSSLKKIRFNGSPVLLTHHDSPQLDLLVHELVEAAPLYRFSTRGNREHMLWKVDDDATIKQILELYQKLDALYIADGHHRSAAFSSMNEDNIEGFMSCIIPASQLKIYSFHRLVQDLNKLSKEEFLKKLEEDFIISSLREGTFPDAPGIINLYIEKEWYRLKNKNPEKNIADSTNAKDSLDVSILEKLILQNILQIEDSRTSERVSFVNEAKDLYKLEAKVDSGEMKALFALFPVNIHDVFRISDISETMPPKSTWIEPKLRSGLLMQQF